ncbi:MAG: TonB-dependent receptor [Hyphomonadaceae bacterium]|nr:TonB-dependent receptor [Hyphomonadaceae bacterium]
MTLKTALLGAAAIACFGPVSAQASDDNATTLDTVIVEGSRLDQAETEIGSSVSIITADEIELLGFDFAIDAIASAPGVTVNQNGAFGGVATVRIRGASSAQTLVVIDGIPVNDPSQPSGGFDFARVDTENIERIEILKGPQSTLWGSDAIGGVVSIITKDPEPGFGGTAFAEYGSFNTLRGGASVGNANEVGDFRFAVTGTSSDGISKADENNGNSEEDAYESVTVSAKGGLNFGDARVSADLLWSEAEAEYDAFTFGAQGNVGDGDLYSNTEELSGNLSLFAPAFAGKLENQLTVGYAEITRDNFSNGSFFFGGEGERTTLRYQGTVDLDAANTLAFGATHEAVTIQDEDTTLDGLFGLYEFKPIESLTLTGGFRVDDHSTFGSETTGRVAAAYNPSPSLTFRASWGQGFKAPTINQLTGGGFAAPNPNLQPETSEAIDFGIDWRSATGKAEFSATVFDMEIENQILFATTGYFNEAVTESTGLELAGRYDLNDWLSVSAAYAYIDASDTNGDALIRTPEHSGDIRLSVDPEGPFSGAILIRYNGEEADFGTTQVDAWTRVDLTGSYALSETVEVFGRIENLFDEEYQQILGYGTPDISGSVGIRLRY